MSYHSATGSFTSARVSGLHLLMKLVVTPIATEESVTRGLAERRAKNGAYTYNLEGSGMTTETGWVRKALGLGLATCLIILFSGCAKSGRDITAQDQVPEKLPVHKVLPNIYRIPRQVFSGTFLYLKSLTDVKYPGKDHSELPAGLFLDNDHLVQFVLRENGGNVPGFPGRLDIVAIDPQFQKESDAEANRTLASFPVRYVDIAETHDSRGLPLGEEAETDTLNPWQNRGYVVIDLTGDKLDEFTDSTVLANALETLEIVPTQGSINFDVSRELKDETQVQERYSFLKFQPSGTYQQREYPADLQSRFGFFATKTYRFDRYGRILQHDEKQFMNRWDISKPIVYYLDKRCPDAMKTAARQVFDNWNDVFEAATRTATTAGLRPLKLEDNSGQMMGDLRYNLLTCNTDQFWAHGILGYGPQAHNPRTGEMIKADVNVYLGVLNHAILSEKTLADLEGDDADGSAPSGGAAGASHGASSASPHRFAQALSGFQDLSSLSGLLRLDPSAKTFYERSRMSEDEAAVQHTLATAYPMPTALEKIRADLIREQTQSITRLSGGLLNSIQNNLQANGSAPSLSDDEIAVRIFTPTITHELGHNWGLRHNFKGSADKAHFDPGTHSSSIMDYGAHDLTEPPKPGPYDRAAIAVLYGPESGVSAEVQKNFYYCSDQQTLSSKDALCNQFDAGTSLSEAVKSSVTEYYAKYPLTNFRLDRAHFSADKKKYLTLVLSSLMPIRLAYDNAQGILDAVSNQSVDDLWKLTGQRLEADASSPHCDPSDAKCPVQTITVKVGEKQELKDDKLVITPVKEQRRIDLSKLKRLVADAKQAKREAVIALMGIVLDEDRPSADVKVEGEVYRRGILSDRLVALLLLGNPLTSPAGGDQISPFTSSRGAVGNLLVSLLSNTFPVKGPKGNLRTKTHPFPSTLREEALKLLKSQKGLLGAGVNLPKLVKLDPVRLDDDQTKLLADLEGLRRLASVRGAIDAELQSLTGQARKHFLLSTAKSLGLWLGLKMVSLPSADADLSKKIAELKQARDEADAAVQKLADKEKQAPFDVRALEIIYGYRLQIQALSAERLLGQKLSDNEKAALQDQIDDLEDQRAQAVPFAYYQEDGGGYLRAPLEIPGYEFASASGLLVRDNINRVEDKVEALDALTAMLAKSGANQAASSKLADAAATVTEPLRDYLSTEEEFATKLSRVFQAADGE